MTVMPTPSTHKGGIKSTGLLTGDTQITTGPGLVYYIYSLASATSTLEDGIGAGGTIIWTCAASVFFHFDDPLEFPSGIFFDYSGAGSYIGYKGVTL